MALLLLWHPTELCNLYLRIADMVFGEVLGLQNDRPTSREDIMMDVQIIRLEEESTKYRQDGEILAIGKMNHVLRRRHAVLELRADCR